MGYSRYGVNKDLTYGFSDGTLGACSDQIILLSLALGA
jgi:hypothetical protein